MDRRSFIVGTVASALVYDQAWAQADELQSIYKRLDGDPSIIEDALQEYERTVDKGVGRGQPSQRRLSTNTKDFIINFEVSSPRVYELKYCSPIVPGGSSGLTIGIGYDLLFSNTTFLNRDWPMLSESDRHLLRRGLQKPHAEALRLKPELASVVIPYAAAKQQFEAFLPYPTKETERAFGPNCNDLPDDSFGALVSLIYNRGADMRGVKRAEMRQIRDAMARKAFGEIPALLYKMREHWSDKGNTRGVRIRREAESLLFASGLRSS